MFGIMFTNREIKVSSIVPFKTSINFGVDWELKFEPRLPPEVPYQQSSCLLDILDDQERRSEVDHNDGQFFRAMEWLMFFFLGHHCRQWFFNGFDKVGPSPLNVFLGVQPLEPMVFRWFSKF